MFPLLVKLEKMNLQMEYISDKYNIYTNYQKMYSWFQGIFKINEN